MAETVRKNCWIQYYEMYAHKSTSNRIKDKVGLEITKKNFEFSQVLLKKKKVSLPFSIWEIYWPWNWWWWWWWSPIYKRMERKSRQFGKFGWLVVFFSETKSLSASAIAFFYSYFIIILILQWTHAFVVVVNVVWLNKKKWIQNSEERKKEILANSKTF